LGLIPWFGPVVDPAPRALASLAVLPLVTVLFWVDEYSKYRMFSGWHAAVFGAVFCLLAILCLRSKKPAVVPLFLLLPFLLEPVFVLVVVGLNVLARTGGGSAGILMLFAQELSKVLPILLASGAALALVRYTHGRKA
jgi:hypothetical protein